MRRSILKKPTLALGSSITMAVASLILMTAGTAVAKKVKYVNFGPAFTQCLEDQPYPCEPNQGIGESNILEVHQAEVDGQMTFWTVSSPGVPANTLWAAASFGGKCKNGWSPIGPRVRDPNVTFYSNRDDPNEEVSSGWGGHPIDHSEGQPKIWDHIVDMNIPFEFIFDLPDPFFGLSEILKDFPTIQSIRDYGEAIVQQRIDAGWSPGQARAVAFEYETHIGMHGRLGCRKNNNKNRKQWRYKGANIPVTLKFMPDATVLEQELWERPDVGGSPDLTFGTAIVQAHLSVLPDPTDSCRLLLSGVVVTNDMTEVKYRFVDEAGSKSQYFTTQVDQTYTAYLDHYIDLPPVLPEGVGDDGAIDQLVQEDDGEIGGFVHEESDNEQGTYMIEFKVPHAYESNIAGFNVEPCLVFGDPNGDRGNGGDRGSLEFGPKKKKGKTRGEIGPKKKGPLRDRFAQKKKGPRFGKKRRSNRR